LAFFASLTIGILVALGREHLNPRAASQRDVARVLGIPVLATIPERTRRPLSRTGMLVAAERDAFQSLRTAVEAAMPPGVQKVFVVSSATPGEGKTTVAYRLARSLVSAGQSVLLVGGDLRRPGIGACVGLPNSPGVSDLLGNAASASRAVSGGAIARATRTFMPSDAAASGWATLAVLPSGDPPEDPTALLARDLVWSLFEQIRRLDYEWVVVDAPPVLGPADARVLAGVADALLLVSRLGAVTMEQLRSEREAIDTLEVEPLGVVVIGAPVEPGAYELGPVRRDRNHSRAPLAVRPERLRRPRAVPID
jgi:receptor protein-tyrosine kinase